MEWQELAVCCRSPCRPRTLNYALSARFDYNRLGVLPGKFGPEEILVIEGHGQREDRGGVAVLPHAHHHTRGARAERRLPGSDRQPRGAVGDATMFAKCTST